MDFYTEQLARKRSWTPTCGERMNTMPGADQVLGRALALRVLELEVAEWLDDALGKTTLPATAVECLRSNILDEERHDKVLGRAAQIYQLTTDGDEAEAKQIHQQWIHHPDQWMVRMMNPLLMNLFGLCFIPVSR